MLLLKNDKNDSLSETVKPPRRLFFKVRTLLWENNIKMSSKCEGMISERRHFVSISGPT